MNRSIEQALISLLPTHNADLPQPLADLASSLLAQSHHRASALKADEEIARPYACAHLACDRLKVPLNLPPIQPRPPVPPRIYKRLYAHLDSALTGTPSTPRRGPGRTRAPSIKLREAAAARAPGPATPPGRGARQRGRGSGSGSGLPAWVRPTIRAVCGALDAGADVGRTVAAGMEAIVAPHGRRAAADAWVRANAAALLAALGLYVWGFVAVPRGVDEARYVRAREAAVEAVNRARAEVVVEGAARRPDEEEGAWEGWREIQAEDVDEAALRIDRLGWLESDWARGIEGLIERRGGHGDDGGAGQAHDGEAEQVQAGPVGRADTMFQDRYDFLNERRRKEYAAWKEGILERIREMEKGRGVQ